MGEGIIDRELGYFRYEVNMEEVPENIKREIYQVVISGRLGE